MKKLISVICVCLLAGLFVFIGVWSYINFDDLKLAMSGTQIYTKDDIDKAYKDGYDKALDNQTDYNNLLSEYREDIASLTDEVSKLKYKLSENEDTISKNNIELIELNKQLESSILELDYLKTTNQENLIKIEELESHIEYLSSSIALKEKEIALLTKQNSDYLKSIDYYKNFITTLETETSAVATFIYDGKVIHLEILTKGSYVTYNHPSDTEYVKFNYWTVNGVQVDLANYPINTNTTFIANIDKSYNVCFYVDSNLITTKIVLDGNNIPTIEDPIIPGYNFIGWSLDGITILDSNYVVETNVDLFAMFEPKTWNINYSVDDNIVHTEYVKTNNSPIGFSIEDTDRKVFIGWTLDGSTIINVEDIVVSSDITLIAVFEYYYSVNYIVNNVTVNSILCKNGSSPMNYLPNESSEFEFIGWTIDGQTIIDLNSIIVEHDIVLIALVKKLYFDIYITSTNSYCHQSEFLGNDYCYVYEYSVDLSDYFINDNQPFTITFDWIGDLTTNRNLQYKDFTYMYYSNSDNEYLYSYFEGSDPRVSPKSFDLYISSNSITFVGLFDANYCTSDILSNGFQLWLHLEVCK